MASCETSGYHISHVYVSMLVTYDFSGKVQGAYRHPQVDGILYLSTNMRYFAPKNSQWQQFTHWIAHLRSQQFLPTFPNHI